MLSASQLGKRFGSRHLFDGASLQLRPKDRVGLVGPNGAGKTTLLKMLVGEEAPDEGTVSLGAEERAGYLPQEPPRVSGGSALERVLDGARAVKELGERITAVEHAMAHADAAGAMALAEEHAGLLDRYRVLDGYTLEGRAQDALRGLGFVGDAMHRPVDALSGGWWMRVELARLLVAQPEYLLLDEPTNHLDATSIEWLEQFLRNYAGAWLIVSHDRYFLNRTVERIAALDHDGIAVYPGNYDFFVEAQAEIAAQLAAQAEGHRRKAAELEAFIDRFRAKASKAKQAQSRVKALERMGDAPPPAASKRVLKMNFKAPPPSGKEVMRLTQVSKRYGDKTLYDRLDVTIQRGDKIAIVGPNGAGKTTLLRMLAGTLAPDTGARKLGHQVTPYYFAQHSLEMLDAQKTVLEHMQQTLPDSSPTVVRGMLGAFLFRGDMIEAQVGVLSGGEKNRLALALMLATPANLLLLDEPTNHLDLGSRDVLESALTQYAGTLVCISHDRYFLTQVATRIWSVSENAGFEDFEGTFEAYQWHLQQRQAVAREAAPAQRATEAPKGGTAGGESYKDRKAQARVARQKEQKIAAVEAEIAAAEARVKEIDAQLCDPAVFNDTQRSRDLLRERETLQDERLPAHMATWEALSLAD